MDYKFLLVGNREDSPSFYSLWNALTSLGELHILPQDEALQQISRSKYDMVIVDAAALDDKAVLVSQIRTQQPHMRIIVLTASPTWRRARQALQAGAMDYLIKTLSEKEYLDKFKDVLAGKPKPLP